MQRPRGWIGSRKEEGLDNLSGRREQRGKREWYGVKLAGQAVAAPGVMGC